MEDIFLMWNFREVYSNRKGFTLVEMVLYFGIASIVIASLYSILLFINNATAKSNSLDDALLNGRFAIEYIKAEITDSDMIICSSKFDNLDKEYPNNIGFVSMKESISYKEVRVNGKKETKIENIKYNFRTYYIEDGSLRRIAYTSHDLPIYNSHLLSGNNKIFDGILESDCVLDGIDNTIKLSFKISTLDKPFLLETIINIRCPLDQSSEVYL